MKTHNPKHNKTNTSNQNIKAKTKPPYPAPPSKRALIQTESKECDEEITLEIDLLEVVFYFAGIKEEKIKEALEAYIKELDTFDEDSDYGKNEIIQIIKNIKQKRGDLFKD